MPKAQATTKPDLAKREIEEEPEVLNLQPSSTRRINAKVRRYYEPARLQIMEENEVDVSEQVDRTIEDNA